MPPQRKPLPHIDQWNRPFWEGARAGQLRMQRCTNCSQFRFPPAPLCAGCGCMEFKWAALSGYGSIFSWVVFHKAYFPGFADEIPYAVVLVELDEGPQLYGNLPGTLPSDIRIGMRVETRFIPVSDDISLPQFVTCLSAPASTVGS